MPRAATSRRLFLERLVQVVAAASAFYAFGSIPTGYQPLALAALSLSASALFPALTAAVWWPRASRIGVMLGMIAGFAVSAYVVAADLWMPELFERLLSPELIVLARQLGASRASILAVPVGLLVLAFASFALRGRTTGRIGAKALQSPRDLTPFDDPE